MRGRYAGPLRDEPVAVELHNTLRATDDEALDWLAAPEAAEAFVAALAPRLDIADAPPGRWPTAAELVELRTAVRAVLHDAVDRPDAPDAEKLEALNATAARAASSPRVVLAKERRPKASVDYHGATRSEIVLAAIAADALTLIAGPRRAKLRACHAPGCDYYFFQDRPRRAWCSNACGNRARQARHYERTRHARSH